MIKLENPTVGFNWKNAALLALFFSVCVSMQAVLPWSLFGTMVAPVVWMLFIFYVILYRPFIQSLVLNYIFCIILHSTSGVSLKVLLLSMIALTLVLNSVKKRIFIPGFQYFLILAVPSLLTFQIIYTLISAAVEPVPALFDFRIRILELLLTPLFAAPIFVLMEWVDKKTLNPQSFRSEEII